MMLEVVLGVISITLILFWLLSPSSRVKELGNKIPGPKAVPLIGNALSFQIIGPNAFNCLRQGRKEFGSIFRLWLGPQLHIVLTHPEDIQMLLTSQTLITKAKAYETLNNWLGTGLLISTGQLWQKRRKAITPTFHFKMLDEFAPIFKKCGATMITCLKEHAGSGPFDIMPFLSNCALDAVSESAMGIRVEAQTKPKSDYVLSITEMTKKLSEKINNPLLALEPLYTISGRKAFEQKKLSVLHSLPLKVLNEKKAALENKKNFDTDKTTENGLGIKQRKAFLELLLNIRNQDHLAFQSDQDVMDEVTTFMFEGHDTTTSCLTFTIWLLGKNPHIQETLYSEIAGILDHNDDIQIENLNEMKYLERVIKESLRLFPPVPLVGRKLLQDTTFPSGYTLPAGADVSISIILIHRDPEFFPDPDKFDPDRFLTEQKHPYVYIPFSAGPRNCIGQKFAMLELKSILSQVVYNYKIAAEEDVIMDLDMVTRSANGLTVSLTSRSH